MKTIGSKVQDDIYDVFRLLCEKDGVTISERVKDLVNKFVNEETPYVMLDEDISEQLKTIAKEKGVDWREMACAIILKFCEQCSREKEAKTETETEKEGKEEGSIEEKLKTVKIIRE